MSLEIVTSWQTLFAKAHARGQAFLRYKNSPTEKNRQIYEQANADLKVYENLCLEADRMVGLPYFGDIL